MGEGSCITLGAPKTFSPRLQQFHIMSLTQSVLSSLTSLKAWGDAEKFHNDIAFLLVSTKEEAMEKGCIVFLQYG